MKRMLIRSNGQVSKTLHVAEGNMNYWCYMSDHRKHVQWKHSVETEPETTKKQLDTKIGIK